MRVLALVLAILLLPLRGWLGDAMAMEVVERQVAAVSTHDVHPQREASAASEHAGHAMHGVQATEDADPGAMPHDGATPSDCSSTCTSCQLCHSVAMTLWPEVPTSGEAPRAAP